MVPSVKLVRSGIPGTIWFHLPGCIAQLRAGSAVLAEIRSPRVGLHVLDGVTYSNFWDARCAAEKAAV